MPDAKPANQLNRLSIDTNVFLHLLNPAADQQAHIGHLFVCILKLKPALCVDQAGKISAEYDSKLGPLVSTSTEVGIERVLISQALQLPREEGLVDRKGPVYTKVEKILHEKDESVDRAFVTVACIKSCMLITNDSVHILARVSELKKALKKYFKGGTAIMNSLDARELLASRLPPT